MGFVPRCSGKRGYLDSIGLRLKPLLFAFLFHRPEDHPTDEDLPAGAPIGRGFHRASLLRGGRLVGFVAWLAENTDPSLRSG